MKKVLNVLALAAFLFAATPICAQHATAEAEVWQEMEAFHTIMSQTWHPVEEGNYAPIRERSAELAEVAKAWNKSKIPASYAAQKDIKKNLKELAEDAEELNKEIAKGISDEEIKEELHELHELFHTIVGLCKE